MKANVEKLKELTLPELITVYRLVHDKWNYKNDVYANSKQKDDEVAKTILRLHTLGTSMEKLIDEKINEFIIE